MEHGYFRDLKDERSRFSLFVSNSSSLLCVPSFKRGRRGNGLFFHFFSPRANGERIPRRWNDVCQISSSNTGGCCRVVSISIDACRCGWRARFHRLTATGACLLRDRDNNVRFRRTSSQTVRSWPHVYTLQSICRFAGATGCTANQCALISMGGSTLLCLISRNLLLRSGRCCPARSIVAKLGVTLLLRLSHLFHSFEFYWLVYNFTHTLGKSRWIRLIQIVVFDETMDEIVTFHATVS